MLYQMSYSILLHERNLWLRQLLADSMPLVKCLSLAGTQLILEMQSCYLRNSPLPFNLRAALVCDSDSHTTFFPSWLISLCRLGLGTTR